jgi:tRNA 2-thiouridine synthesizing protein A
MSDTNTPNTPMPDADHILDTCGLYCPEPVMLLHNKIRDMRSGEVVQVLATDPSTQRDIAKFCTFLGHQLLDRQERDAQFIYFIRKA